MSQEIPSTLRYLLVELNLKSSDWLGLSDQEKETLKLYAEEEMKGKGMLLTPRLQQEVNSEHR